MRKEEISPTSNILSYYIQLTIRIVIAIVVAMSLIVLFVSRTVLVERLIASSPRTSRKDFIKVFDTRVRYYTIEPDTLDVIVNKIFTKLVVFYFYIGFLY